MLWKLTAGVRADRAEKSIAALHIVYTNKAVHITSRTVVAPFLKHPGIAIRIGEVGKAGIVSSRGVEPGCEPPVPCSNGRLVPDLIDVSPTFEQTAPRRLEIGDDEIDVAK